MTEGLQHGLTIVVNGCELQDPLFDLLQASTTVLDQGNTLLIAEESFVQSKLSFLKILDDRFQLGKRIFEARFIHEAP